MRYELEDHEGAAIKSMVRYTWACGYKRIVDTTGHPVRPTTSRKAQRSGVSGSISSWCCVPLTVIVTIARDS